MVHQRSSSLRAPAENQFNRGVPVCRSQDARISILPQTNSSFIYDDHVEKTHSHQFAHAHYAANYLSRFIACLYFPLFLLPLTYAIDLYSAPLCFISILLGRWRLLGFRALGVVIFARFGLEAQGGVRRCQSYGQRRCHRATAVRSPRVSMMMMLDYIIITHIHLI